MDFYNGLSASELVIRYQHNYNLQPGEVTFDMVMKHWNLEKKLTKELLASSVSNRNAVFINAYNTLYTELPWLLKSGSDVREELSLAIYSQRWLSLLGEVSGKLVYEIGSGNGNLIRLLASLDAQCIGTEITEGRPNNKKSPNLSWHVTDGVNLSMYEPEEHFDLVISDQVIEHLHPDDTQTHFDQAYRILKPSGKYVFYTPHYYIGPGDVSRIFNCAEAEGMHLKEYKYKEIFRYLKKAGFKKISIPKKRRNKDQPELLKLTQLFIILEQSLSLVWKLSLKKRLYHRLYKFFGIDHEIVIIAQR